MKSNERAKNMVNERFHKRGRREKIDRRVWLGGFRSAFKTISLSKKLVNESTLRELVKPLFYTRMRLGEFDPPEMNPYTRYY